MNTMTTSWGRVRKISTKTVIATSAGLQCIARTIASASPVPTPSRMVSSATSTVTQNPPRTDGPYWARIFTLKKFSASGPIKLSDDGLLSSLAGELVRRRVISLEAGRAVARENGADRRARINLGAVPFLVELHERAVLL